MAKRGGIRLSKPRDAARLTCFSGSFRGERGGLHDEESLAGGGGGVRRCFDGGALRLRRRRQQPRGPDSLGGAQPGSHRPGHGALRDHGPVGPPSRASTPRRWARWTPPSNGATRPARWTSTPRTAAARASLSSRPARCTVLARAEGTRQAQAAHVQHRGRQRRRQLLDLQPRHDHRGGDDGGGDHDQRSDRDRQPHADAQRRARPPRRPASRPGDAGEDRRSARSTSADSGTGIPRRTRTATGSSIPASSSCSTSRSATAPDRSARGSRTRSGTSTTKPGSSASAAAATCSSCAWTSSATASSSSRRRSTTSTRTSSASSRSRRAGTSARAVSTLTGPRRRRARGELRATMRFMRGFPSLLALVALVTPHLAFADAPVHAPPAAPEARISVDFKDADIVDIVRLMSEVGQFQVVVDPGISCKLTLKLKEVPWDTTLDIALRVCGLGSERRQRDRARRSRRQAHRGAPGAPAARRGAEAQSAAAHGALHALLRARRGARAPHQEVPLAARATSSSTPARTP